MPDWLKKFGAAISAAEGIRGVITSPLVWPWLSGAVGAVLAYLDGYDKTAIFLAGLAAFAFVSGGLLWFEERRARRSPENRLRIAGYGFHRDFTAPAGGEVRLEYVQLAIVLVNDADFPISVRAESVRNEIVQRVGGHIQRIQPPEAFTPATFTLAPKDVLSIRAKRIPMAAADCRIVEGELSHKLCYGRPGKERYRLDSPWARGVTARFNPADGAQIGMVWSLDAREPTA